MLQKFVFAVLIFSFNFSFSQTRLTLEEADAAFLKNNLILLAEEYNIDVYKAAVIQAKIWEQPYLSGEFNVINPQDNRFFDAGKNGQKGLAVEQLIYLGGKKKKEIDFAKNNQAIAELEYEQLIRTLRFELQNQFYQLYFSQEKFNNLTLQLKNLDTLILSYGKQTEKGNISLKDLVRLESLSLSLRANLSEIQSVIFQAQSSLKILTGINEDFLALINPNMSQLNRLIVFTNEELKTKAIQQNIELQISKKLVESNELNIAWQKALAIPDLTIGAAYDQRGGAFQNQTNLTFGIPLPLWNKNKGNIKISQSLLDQSKTLVKQKELEISNEVNNALKTFLFYQNQYNQTISTQANFEKVYEGVLQNFQKRNISLIEFTDFMESYNQSLLYLNDIKTKLFQQGYYLNFLCNETIF